MNTPMFDPIRYKTEMCKNYLEFGVCKFSDRCLYAHHEWERRPTTYKHKNHKTKPCKAFHSDGFCEFGSRCAFIHSKPDVDTIVQDLDQFIKRIPQPHHQHMVFQQVVAQQVFQQHNGSTNMIGFNGFHNSKDQSSKYSS